MCCKRLLVRSWIGQRTPSARSIHHIKCADFIQRAPKEPAPGFKPLSNAQRLEFYAAYKQGTIGKNTTDKPGMFNLEGRYKWDAWTQLGDMTPEAAMQKYVDLAIPFLKQFAGMSDEDLDKYISTFKPESRQDEVKKLIAELKEFAATL
ncbi:hypothetical protein SeMB42_g05907 [Synchytrium endobioticum]|uniref:ACB domain-containing protein n=1 Tax=Synchytrium endobioticum TaxID=286115 RepID=A0A507CNF5_9FUNG|nr:hypothetical protein SeMB42_g05907 [Synchytrium endobioticum]TPX45305.1 hypothetical protein SeLEV6574_g03943 [Synchytrium endobioticum]